MTLALALGLPGIALLDPLDPLDPSALAVTAVLPSVRLRPAGPRRTSAASR